MDDLISRQAAVEAILAIKDYGNSDRANALGLAECAITTLPSAQLERKKGKWIYNSPVTMKCNQCGFVIKDWDWHRFKYCPNCIADMRGDRMDDLISRAAVVDAIEGVDWYHINRNGEMVHGANDAEHQAWYKAEDIYKAVESVPSAQQDCDGCKWSDAIGYGECHHCKRAFEDMYEKGEQP